MPTLTPTADQIEDARACVERKRFALHSKPGAGKTIALMEALSRVVDLGSDTACHAALIVVPRIAMYQWRMILIDYGYEPVVLNTNADVDSLPDEGVLLTTWAIANANIGKLKDWCPEVVILDEAHALVRASAQRTQGFFGYWDRETRKDVPGLAQQAEYCWLATGTPMLAYPDDLHPWLSRLHPEVLRKLGVSKARHQFRMKFCQMVHNGFGFEVKGGKNEHLLFEALYNGADRIAVRREVDAGLPPLTTLDVEIDLSYATLSPEWRKVLRDAEKLPVQVLAQVLEKGNGADDDSHPATIRRAFGLAKVPGAVEYLQGLPAEQPRIVFFWHSLVGQALAEALPGAALLDGKTSAARKDAIVADFKAGRITTIVGQIGAMGAALDGLQTVAHHIYYAERVGSPALMEQATARLYRRGQKERVQIVTVRAGSPLEAATDLNLKRKGEAQRKVMAGA